MKKLKSLLEKETKLTPIIPKMKKPLFERADKDVFKYQREVSFFLRLHRHLPDEFCGGSPLSSCKYRPDGIPINGANDYVEELQKDPDFRQKEKEIEEAVSRRFKNNPLRKIKGLWKKQ